MDLGSVVSHVACSLNQTACAVSKEMQCPVEGNADLYGLGIRAGIYIQMWTVQLSSLAGSWLPMEDNLGESTIIFVLAAAIVLVRELVKLSLQPVEAFPVITMLFLQIAVCRNSYRSATVLMLGVACFLGLTTLSVWFWWHGMDTLPRRCPDDKAFFFAKVSIWHWFRTFNKVTSIFAAISGGIMAIFFFITFFFYGIARVTSIAQGGRSVRVSPGQQLEARQNAAANGKNAGGLDIAVNIGIVVFVEMALKWNHVKGVHTLDDPGQFMPFFIALAQLLNLVLEVVKTVLRLDADESHFYDNDDDLECPHHTSRQQSGHNGSIPLTAV